MISLRINGSEAGLQTQGLSRVSEIIELIKASIDPNHIITSILIDGRDLQEHEWAATTSQLGTCILEFETGTAQDYVAYKLSEAAMVVRTCYIQYRDARKSFQQGNMLKGNQKLLEAVTTSKAFFEWYSTLMELVPVPERPKYDINPQVKEISKICERICQQQLYQSWWALGETLEKELEPKLDNLEDFCNKFCIAV